MNITYLPNNSPWKLSAKTEYGSLVFSAVFSRRRRGQILRREKVELYLNLALLALGTLGLLVGGIELAILWPSLGTAALAEVSVLSLLFWITLFTDVYLIARLWNIRVQSKKYTLRFWQNLSKPEKVPQDVFNYFTPQAKKYWLNAYTIAKQHGGIEVTATDIFFSLLMDEGVIAIFKRFGANVTDIKMFLVNYMALQPLVPLHQEALQKLPFAALAYAERLRLEKINPLALFCALAQTMPGDHIIHSFFAYLELTEQRLETASLWQLAAQRLTPAVSLLRGKYSLHLSLPEPLLPIPTHFLRKFGKNLTAAAKAGRLSPSLGRNDALEELEQLFSKQKQTVLFVGHTGIGKRSLINELAYRIATEHATKKLSGKQLIEIDLLKLLKQKKSEISCSLQALLEESADLGNVVLVLPDIHTLLTHPEIPELLQLMQFLKKNSLPCIATTTPENAEQLKKATDFGAVFSTIALSPLTGQAAVLACCLKASLLESHSHLYFHYAAVEQAVTLSNTYLKTKVQPQAGISVLVKTFEEALAPKNAGLVIKQPNGRKLINEFLVQKVVSEMAGVPLRSL